MKYLSLLGLGILLIACDPVSPRVYVENCEKKGGMMIEIIYVGHTDTKEYIEWKCVKRALKIP